METGEHDDQIQDVIYECRNCGHTQNGVDSVTQTGAQSEAQ